MNYEERTRLGGGDAIRDIDPFFGGTGPVPVTLRRIAGHLDHIGVCYAVCGGMALNAHGYRRMTIDVDVIVSAEGLRKAHEALPPLGYVKAGKTGLRDLETTVRIDFVVGAPEVSERIDGISYVTLPALIDAKIALGNHPARIKHVGDVQEMIKRVPLPREISAKLTLEGRATYEKHWDMIMSSPRELW